MKTELERIQILLEDMKLYVDGAINAIDIRVFRQQKRRIKLIEEKIVYRLEKLAKTDIKAEQALREKMQELKLKIPNDFVDMTQKNLEEIKNRLERIEETGQKTLENTETIKHQQDEAVRYWNLLAETKKREMVEEITNLIHDQDLATRLQSQVDLQHFNELKKLLEQNQLQPDHNSEDDFHKDLLKLTIPIIPLVLKYESHFEISNENLAKFWNSLTQK